MDNCKDYGADNYCEIKDKLRQKLDGGIHAHSKHIKLLPGMKPYVKMFLWSECDRIIQLQSEPFTTLFEAQHFAEVFSDCFLCEAECIEETGLYYVYSGWILKEQMMSYSLNSKGAYYEFANWS